MKPLTHCPYCNAPLRKKDIPPEQNPFLYELCSKRCAVDYFQYFANSYEDEELQYISFDTPKGLFNVHSYFNYPPIPYTTYVYSHAELKKNGVANPLLKLPKFAVDVYSLDKLEEKFSIYAVFV